MFPPIPAWEHAHPIIVHLPLGGLVAAPVLILLAMFAGKSRLPLAIAALVVLAIGMVGGLLATASGHAASDAVSIPARAVKVLERHEELAELCRNVLLAITLAYGAIVGVCAIMKDRFKRTYWIAAQALALGAVSGSLLLLANTGHEGGRLVHEFGVRAHIVGTPSQAPTPRDDN
jgi:uncharacterized membrane protein